jgi:membrane-associated phospholipid phosphatase
VTEASPWEEAPNAPAERQGSERWHPHPVLYLSSAVIGLILLLGTAVAIDGDHEVGPEGAIFSVINGLPGALVYVLWLPMQFGNMVVVPIATALAAVYRRWVLAAGFLLVGAGKYAGARIVKDAVQRHRPAQVVDDVTLRAGTHAEGLAFVSGHVAIAVGIAIVAHHHLSRSGRILVWALAALTALGRIYVGAHLPLDVVGGAGMGIFLGSVVNLGSAAIQRYQLKRGWLGGDGRAPLEGDPVSD